MKCQKCGANLENGALFCKECGEKIDSATNRFCRKCGAALEENDVFCSMCGASVILQDIGEEKSLGDQEHRASESANTDTQNDQREAGSYVKQQSSDKTTGLNRWIADKIRAATDLIKKRKKLSVAAVAVFLLLMALVSRGCGAAPRTGGQESSDGRIKMINVVDMTYPEALKALKKEGFTNVSSNVDQNAEESLWIVTKQSISEGKEIRAGEEIMLTCAVKCKLYIDVHSEFNLLFGVYDITITLDGSEIGTVANGENFSYLAEVLSGEHTILFCKSGNSSPKANRTISVKGDLTYACTLDHSNSSINIKNETREENVDKSSLEVVDVTGMVLSEAISKLKEAGFTNVRGEPYGDIRNKENWIVISQGIEAGTTADKNEFFQLDCISTEDYFNNSFTGKALNEIQELAELGGFSLKYCDESGNSLDSVIASLDESAKNDWVATRAKQYSGTEKTAMVTLSFTGEIVKPTPEPTPEPTPKAAPFTDANVKKTLYAALSAEFDAKEYKIDIDRSMLIISFYPEGLTATAYKASALGNTTAIRDWNALVDTAKSWSNTLSETVHDTMNRDDLKVLLYYCDDIGSGNVYLVVMDGVVYYDIVNKTDLLGIGF